MAYNKKYATLGESVIDYVNNREDAIEASFNDVDTDINGVSQELNDFKAEVADYVVDFGENWEKWNSGKLVQRKSASVTFPSGTEWGNLYYHDFSLGDWEIPFTTITYAKENVRNNTYWSNIAAYSTTSTGTIRVFRPTVGGATSVAVTVEGIGRWK